MNEGSSRGPIFKTFLSAWCLSLALSLVLALGSGEVGADIYQYRDKDGHWVFTDVPPAGVGEVEIIRDGRSARTPVFRDIEKEMTEKFPPKSAVEAASLGTVTIRTVLGLGSGFFVSEDGYILTNKHVLRGDESQIRKTEEFIARVDDRIEEDEAAMANAENQLKRMKSELDDYRAYIDGIKNPRARREAMEKYKSQAEEYSYYDEQFRRRKREFEERKSEYRREKGDFTRKTRMAEYEDRFTVVLKDKTEIEASLVAVSEDHDLALLKADGCRTPYIKPGEPGGITQGMRVFAIGSPLGVSDSVSSGIVSGYDDAYIRTDAKIYLGNSGGPLVTTDGKVIGINTLKLITQKFEGMGFAIPLSLAFREFSTYLKTNPW